MLIAGLQPTLAIDVGDVKVDYRQDRYHVFGESIIEAPNEFIFDALTDYENFHLLADGIAETKFLVEDGEKLGYTRVDTCILFFCRAVEKVERLEINAPETILAEAIPERSHYRISKTRWDLEPVDGGTKVTFVGEIRPDFWLPSAIGSWAIRRKLMQSAEDIGVNIEFLHRRNLTLEQYARLSRRTAQSENLKPTPKLR